ncbi:MAG: FAD:protein FMN transferase [Microbacterium sp.]|uniref:FAD:protein FMN transferase n=1 Tax=Microbacterium sp. TaxID=51671 RepID=UPI003F7D9201
MTRPRRHVEVAQIMGTAISVHVVGDVEPAAFARATAACFDELREADHVFSPYRDDSDILRMARGELAMKDASPWVAEVAEACAHASADTGGLFTAWWSGVFDPTGYVKGWAVERVARRHLAPLTAERGVVAAGINAGGDLQLFTTPGADWTWNVAVVDPADRSRVIATIPVRDGAVATSGTAERGAHIVDPRCGLPATGVASATVTSASLAHADVWATAAVVAGPDDLGWISRAGLTAGILVADDGRVRRWLDGVEVEIVAAAE